MIIDRFYKENATLPTKKPTDFKTRDCRLLFHKNDYSDEFIDTNHYKQNKQNDDFELYVTKDHFHKAYGTLPTKTPTEFEQYVTAAELAVYKLVTDLQSFTLMMASAQVVETSVNTNNSPSQDYTTNPDDHSNHNIDSPGFKPFTVMFYYYSSVYFIFHIFYCMILYLT